MKGQLKSIIVLTVICAIAAAALAGVNNKTKEKIKEEELKFTLRSVAKAIPQYNNHPEQDVVLVNEGNEKICIYRGRQDDKLTGFAIPAVDPNGYSGNVKILVGVLPDGSLSGIEILSHAETPGLGSRVEEKAFRDRFIWTCSNCENKQRRTIDNTRWIIKKDSGDIDEITGASISSRAVTRAVKKAIDIFNKNRDILLSENSGTTCSQ